MQKIEEFREVIRAFIITNSSPCLEREIRQAYWYETGFNVDAVLQKVVQPDFVNVNKPKIIFCSGPRPSVVSDISSN